MTLLLQPSPSPTLPTAPSPNTIQNTVVARQSYEGAIAQRRELRSQLDRLENQRMELRGALRDRSAGEVDRAGLEARLKEVDGRIATLDGTLAAADLALAQAAAVPGAVQTPRQQNDAPDEVIPIVFIIFVLCPIAIAYARRLWKRAATVAPPVSREMTDRLDQLAQAVESIAVETERIGEGQRFLTRVMTEQGRQLGTGPAQPVAVPVPRAEPVEQPRRGG